MIRVLLADDEAYFRAYMEQVIDWEKEGMSIRANCKNASEVMEYFSHDTADIVLLDINMPGMNGILAAEEIKRKKPETYIVFITGYSEFEYAKKALKLGAEDYLLKPFSKTELTGCLQKIMSKMKMKRMEKQRHRLDEKIVTEELLRRWIHSIYDEDEEAHRKNLHERNIFWNKSCFYAVVLEADAMPVMRKRQEDIALWEFIVENITGEICGFIDPQRILFRDFCGQLVVILNTEGKIEKDILLKKLKEIQNAVRSITKYTISMGISQCVEREDEITGAYGKAVRVLGEKFFAGNECILFAEDLPLQSRKMFYFHIDLSEQLLGALRKHEKDKMDLIIKKLEGDLKKENFAIEYIYGIISEMISTCLSYVAEMNGSIEKIYGDDFEAYAGIYHLSSLSEVFLYVRDIYGKAEEAFRGNVSKRGREIIQQVENFIAENYQDYELTVEKIAEGIFLDSSYVRRVVSRQLGCTVSSLLSIYRMKKAKELLKDTNFSVSEIAEKVGYGEPGYFSRCFRKYYGITPREFAAQSKGL